MSTLRQRPGLSPNLLDRLAALLVILALFFLLWWL
jgi:hypothetical protein